MLEKHSRSLTSRLAAAAWTALTLVALAAVGLTALRMWLSPHRLARIVSREASARLDADIQVGEVGFSLRHFPWVYLDATPVSIVSRSLRGLPDSVRANIPHGADSLFSAQGISLSLNLRSLASRTLEIKDLRLAKPQATVVMASDSLTNLNILPKGIKTPRLDGVRIGKTHIDGPLSLRFASLPLNTDISISIPRLLFKPGNGGTTCAFMTELIARGTAAGQSLPDPLPVECSALADLSPSLGSLLAGKNPLSVAIRSLSVSSEGVSARISALLHLNGKPVVKNGSFTLDIPDPIALTRFVPASLLAQAGPLASMVSGTLPLTLSASLLSPMPLPPAAIPAFNASMAIERGNLGIALPAVDTVPVSDLRLLASVVYDPVATGLSQARLSHLSFTTLAGTHVAMSGQIDSLFNNTHLLRADFSLNADLSRLERRLMPARGMTAKGRVNLSSSLSGILDGLGRPSPRSLKVKSLLTASGIAFNDKSSATAVALPSLSISATSRLGQGQPLYTSLSAFAPALTAVSGGNRVSLDSLALALDAVQLPSPRPATSWTLPATSDGDRILAASTPHTPLLLVPDASSSPLLPFLNSSQAGLSLRAARGDMLMKAWPLPVSFAGLDLHTDLDSLSLSPLLFTSGPDSLHISGNARGILPFLTSQTAAPLRLDFDARFNNVDFNRLFAAYYEGQSRTSGHAPDFNVPPVGAPKASDSLCVAIPRNLFATVRLSTDRAQYLDYSFSPMSAVLSCRAGTARIGDLHIATPYADATLDWTYNTADLSRIYMDIDVDLDRFDIPAFVKAYPALLPPDLPSVTGEASGTLRTHFDLFPSMFVNAPSMTALADFAVDSLTVARNSKKLTRITHLLCIPGDEPLFVNPVAIHASFHDNLLQLDPFFVDISDKYRLMFAGVNNLQGEIYYHAGLMKSPFHLPFGVNLVGNWHKPKIRLGGEHVHDGRERLIAADLRDNVDFNVMTQLAHGWLEFVALAGKYGWQRNYQALSTVPNQ